MRLPGQASVTKALDADCFILKDNIGRILQEQLAIRDNVFVFFYNDTKFYGMVSFCPLLQRAFTVQERGKYVQNANKMALVFQNI
jgi:hypothetical protein